MKKNIKLSTRILLFYHQTANLVTRFSIFFRRYSRASFIVICRFQSVGLLFHWSTFYRPENWSYSALFAGSLLCRGNKVRQGGHREILDRRRFARNQDPPTIPHLFLNKFNKATISVPISSSARDCLPSSRVKYALVPNLIYTTLTVDQLYQIYYEN